MGKRKSRMSKLVQKKKKMPKLDIIFKCPICEHNDAVSCYIDLEEHYGEANCVFCEGSYTTAVNHMTIPIDIYSEWIDKCEEANKAEQVMSNAQKDTTASRSSII